MSRSSNLVLCRDAPLECHNSFRVPAQASWLAEIGNPALIPEILAIPELRNRPVLVLGAGSNVLFTKDFDGLVLVMANQGKRVLGADSGTVLVRAEAGVGWHDLVGWTLNQNLCGLENLALIPGTAGAAPIQNIGAYGSELSEVLDTVEAYDRHDDRIVRLDRIACRLGYRESRFKQEPDRWVITAIELRLRYEAPLKTNYPGVAEELATRSGSPPTARDVAEAISRLRRRKLPDPAEIGNAGSFFKNPILPPDQFRRLHERFPALPVYDTPAGKKLSAAWLIEHAGWGGFREGDVGVSPKHALVLVNYGHGTGAQVWALAQRIQDSVWSSFGLHLEPEPRIL
jgi:UDP-N-acetylmuramate dehydrogenase